MTPLEPYLYWLSAFNCYFNAGERTETWGNQEIEKPQKKRDYGEAWEIKRSVDAQWIEFFLLDLAWIFIFLHVFPVQF